MSLIYKTLFEVKLMHEFYLTDATGKNFFSFPNQQDRINFLLQQFTDDQESINDDVEYDFPDELKSTFENYNLKLLTTYSGFKVAVRVNEIILSDNSVVFQPLTPLPDDLNIYVLLSKKDNQIDSYTNSLFSINAPFIYFFSNEDLSSAKTFPFLSSAISPFNAANVYEQGQLASFGTNDIREFYKNTSGDQWNNVTGNGFANENDLLLLSTKFSYSFNNASNITSAQFVLKDKNASTIKTISVAQPTILKTFLNFSHESTLVSLPETFAISDYIFSLDVTASNGYSKNHKIIFSDNLYNKNYFGVVHIKTKPTNSAFNLFASDGFLIRRKNALGVWTDAPVFEIPVKSKFTYWRYLNDKGKELKLISDFTDYLLKENNVLLSVRPRAIAKSYFLLQKQGSTDTKYIPNPINYQIKRDDKQRIFFDIEVPESELFPVVP